MAVWPQRRMKMIGSGAGDCAPAPSHTTGRAVFRIRRLNPAAYLAARSDGRKNPYGRKILLFRAVCNVPVPARCHAPRRLSATFNIRPFMPLHAEPS